MLLTFSTIWREATKKTSIGPVAHACTSIWLAYLNIQYLCYSINSVTLSTSHYNKPMLSMVKGFKSLLFWMWKKHIMNLQYSLPSFDYKNDIPPIGLHTVASVLHRTAIWCHPMGRERTYTSKTFFVTLKLMSKCCHFVSPL